MSKYLLSLIILLLFSVSACFADWEHSNQLKIGNFKAFAKANNGILAVSYGKGVYLTTNDGQDWIEKNNGLFDVYANTVASIGNNLFLGTWDAGVFISKDGGESWELSNKGMSKFDVTSFLTIGNKIFASSRDGVIYMSEDVGLNWISKSNGIPNYAKILNLKNIDNKISACTDVGLFQSSDYGETWQIENTFKAFSSVTSILQDGNDLFVGTNKGIFHSSDLGINWTEKKIGLTNFNITSISESNKVILISTFGGGVFKSTNNGDKWLPVNLSLKDSLINSIEIIDNYVFATTFKNGVFKASTREFGISKNGDNWRPTGQAILNKYGIKSIRKFIVTDSLLIIGTDQGVFVSKDDGYSWIERNNASKLKGVIDLAYSNKNLIVSKRDENGYNYEMLISTNYGENWANNKVGFPTNPEVITIAIDQNNTTINQDYLFVYALNLSVVSIAGIYRSNNNGINWERKVLNLPFGNGDINLVKQVREIKLDNGIVYACFGESGLFTSSNLGDSWYEKNNGLVNQRDKNTNSISFFKDKLFLHTYNGVFFSKSNVNISFTPYSIPSVTKINCLEETSNSLLIAGTSDGIFYTDSLMKDWYPNNSGLNLSKLSAGLLVVKDKYIYAQTDDGIYKADLKSFTLPTSIEEETTVYNTNNNISISPNPSSNTINIVRNNMYFDVNIQVKYVITSMNGEKVLEFENTDESFEIRTNKLSNGVYIITANQGNKSQCNSFVISK